ncbi:HTH-type transcriptional repressor YtrA [Thalassocella blandensis]|nr:HTH-type transcriptional repressor YtrA [Thalassocella blandensis]
MPAKPELTLPPFKLAQADARPMYEQIIDNIKQLVILGVWPPGMSLPSIRELAVSLNVSVITVKRAYQELDSAGIIVTRHGKGSFVSEQLEQVSQAKQIELTERLVQAAELAVLLNVDITTLTEQLQQLYKEKVNAKQ